MTIKPYLIAEIGINHMGNMGVAKELIREAANNGADAVKFQLYDPRRIFSEDRVLLEEALATQLSRVQFVELFEYAARERIACSASVFDYERLGWLGELSLPFIKIASRTIFSEPGLIDYVCRASNKVIISADWNALEQVKARWPQAARLYCVAKYPADYADYRLPESFSELEYAGLSDHTIGIETALFAIARGARIVEKHFTLSKALPGSDHACSMTPAELRDLRVFGDALYKVYLVQAANRCCD